MKKKVLIMMSVIGLILGHSERAWAAPEDSGAAIATDVLIARPACLAATAIGSVAFVLALPFAAITKSVGRTADALVVTPAKATFTRPLGDFEALKEY